MLSLLYYTLKARKQPVSSKIQTVGNMMQPHLMGPPDALCLAFSLMLSLRPSEQSFLLAGYESAVPNQLDRLLMD